jgi:hypothetical protein
MAQLEPQDGTPRPKLRSRIWYRLDHAAWLDQQVLIRKGLSRVTGESKANINPGHHRT